MKEKFIDFWHLYKPAKEYGNRYRACERLWEKMDEKACGMIIRELKEQTKDEPEVKHRKNPYFYLVDWEPPKPHWLVPREVGHLLAQGIPLAVCKNEETHLFGTVTKAEAELFGLEVHHLM